MTGCLTADLRGAEAWVSTRSSGNMRDDTLRRTFCERCGIDFESLTTGVQVHGTRVAVVAPANRGTKLPDTDGLITGDPLATLAVYTADCLPVFFAAPGKAAGIVHAGWRGLAAGIIPIAVRLFGSELGVAPAELCAVIGPHIGACCYAVSGDVKTAFNLPDDGANLDLTSIARGQLSAAGVGRVSDMGRCTAHETEEFFSYRRQKTDERIMSAVRIAQR